jgi:hypothetical protein
LVLAVQKNWHAERSGLRLSDIINFKFEELRTFAKNLCVNEERTEVYCQYSEGAPQLISGFGAKSGAASRAWIGWKRRGA